MKTSNSIDQINKNSIKASEGGALLLERLKKELANDETLEWHESPVPAYWSGGTMYAVIFGVAWTAFSLFWTYMAAQGSILFAMFGIPFIVIGFGVLLSPVFMRRTMARTIYGITNKRAIIIASKSITSVSFTEFNTLTRTEKNNGLSNLIFRTEQRRDSEGDRYDHKTGFYNIKTAKRAESLISQMRK